MFWVVQHYILVEEVSLKRAAILAESTPCTFGGNTCKEMGGSFVEWTLIRACVFRYVWEEGIETLEEDGSIVGPCVE